MKFVKPNLTFFCLFLSVLVGAFFRFYNLNWDQGYFFNPDESNNIAIPAANLRPSYRPDQFTYGSLTIYLYRSAANIMTAVTNNPAWLQADNINIIGRIITAFISSALIILVFILGKRLYSNKVGLIGAVLTSLNVGLIQASHFGTTETMLAFAGVVVAIAITFILGEKKYQFGYLLAGIAIGLASGAKVSAVIFLVPFFLAHLLSLSKKNFLERTFLLLLTGVVIISTFLIVFPYSLLDFKAFSSSFQLQQNIALGKIPIFFTEQFLQTIPYLFQLSKIFPWILGWPTFIFGILGFLTLIVLALKTRDKKIILLLFLPAFYFLYNGSLFVKWTRYMVPLSPFFCLFSAIAIQYLLKLQKLGKIARGIWSTLILLLITLQFLYALAFWQIYRKTDTRISASQWIYQNIPLKSSFLLEPLDVVALPLPIDNRSPSEYQQNWFDFYGLDNLDNLYKLAGLLSRTDYVIIGSRRIYASRMRLKNTYPVTTKYYTLLFNGSLGFNKIKQVSSYPQLLSWEINDDSAEETFQVFDHPKVMIFKNSKKMSAENLKEILSSD